MKRTPPTDEPNVVAAYATITGAERAVSHLVSLGYDEHDVGIALREFEVVDRHPLRRRLVSWTKLGVVLGAAVAAAVELERRVGAAALWDGVLPTILIGAVAGLLVGGVVAMVVHRRGRAVAGTSPDVLAPTRYDIVVDADHEVARHGLAKWWDPTAPPARWQQPA